MNKSVLLFFATIGGLVGGYIPVLFGDADLSMSILLSTVGGLVGIWLGVIVSKRLG
jgi:uncharacterized membrane protein (UPF0136 family)